MSKILNPENVCANLEVNNKDSLNKLEIMMRMQSELQKTYYGRSLKSFSSKEKVLQTKETIICIIDELMETLERTPWKHWKKYDKDAYDIKGDDKKELCMEVVDIFHFFMNLCELWDIDAKTLYNMYIAKNQENYNRMTRNYSKKNIKNHLK